MTLAIAPITFIEFFGSIVFIIFAIFIAIRLWTYAYFKSKWEQYSNKIQKLL